MDTKQVLVVRSDLKMVRGKEDAQCAHASTAWFACRTKTADTLEGFDDGEYKRVFLNNLEIDWLFKLNTKITVVVNSEEELLDIERRAKEADILCYVVTDEGRTQFNGVPTKTCLALGPDLSDKIDKITGHLKLR